MVHYKFKSVPSKEDLIKIDTSAYYVEIFEGRYYNKQEKKNPRVLIFHKDGYFKSTSVLYHSEHNKRPKNSIYYGGKFKLTDNQIELETFYPSRGGQTNYFLRNIRRGKIEGDRIIFDDDFSLLTIYEKSYEFK